MKFKLAKTSQLGEELLAFFDRIKKAKKTNSAFVKTLGFGDDINWFARPGSYAGVGGIEIDNITPDQKKLWKKTWFGGYFPKQNSKKGKALAQQFAKQPHVKKDFLGLTIGTKEPFVQRPGVNANHPQWILVTFKNEGWVGDNMSEDLQEITTQEYHQIMGDIPENHPAK